MTTYQQTNFFGFTLTGHHDNLRPFYYVDRHPLSAIIKGGAIGMLANTALNVLSWTGATKPVIDLLDKAVEHIPVVSDLCKALGTENVARGAIYVGAIVYKLATRETPYVWQHTDPSFLPNLQKILHSSRR